MLSNAMHNFHVSKSQWFIMDFLECNFQVTIYSKAYFIFAPYLKWQGRVYTCFFNIYNIQTLAVQCPESAYPKESGTLRTSLYHGEKHPIAQDPLDWILRIDFAIGMLGYKASQAFCLIISEAAIPQHPWKTTTNIPTLPNQAGKFGGDISCFVFAGKWLFNTCGGRSIPLKTCMGTLWLIFFSRVQQRKAQYPNFHPRLSIYHFEESQKSPSHLPLLFGLNPYRHQRGDSFQHCSLIFWCPV